MRIKVAHGCIAHVVGRKSEAGQMEARSEEEGLPLGGGGLPWLVQPAQKSAGALREIEHTFLALKHLAATIIARCKILLTLNTIDG
jgi:hypothetical protein